MNKVARQRWASWLLLAALLLSAVPAAALMPSAAQAEGRVMASPDETSANPNEEIVYLDNNGFVKVLDIEPTGTAKQIQFVSPEGGFRNLALGDFNNNGDLEIVAVKGTNASDSVAVIYDPVVSSGATVPGQEINGVPWKEITRIKLAERPETVAAGNFDPNVGGDEIMVVRKVLAGESSANTDTRVVIYKQTTPSGDGSQWTEHSAKNFSDAWERIAVANVNGTGGDEVALVADGAKVEAYQPDQNWRKIFEYGSDCRPPKDAAFGQYFAGGPLELLMVKKQKCSNSSIQPSFQVFAWNGTTNTYNDADKPSAVEQFEPEPQTVFTGDINGNGDDEATMIRNLPDGTTNPRRLFVRGNGGDQIAQDFIDGLPLDSDNGYREGVMADVDGDGKDEIVIMRDNNIRVYPDANVSAQAVNYPLGTNRRSITAGDLDASGSTTGPQFATNVAKVDATVNFGFVYTNTIQIRNSGTEDALGYFAGIEGVNANWLTITPGTSSGTAPGKSSGAATIQYVIDARGLAVGQTYTANIRIVSTGAVQANNSPLLIPVTVKVQTPPFEASPKGQYFLLYPCQDPYAAFDSTFSIIGLPGSKLLNVLVLGPNGMASVAGLTGDTFLATQAADGSLSLVDAAGATTTLAAADVVQVAATDNGLNPDGSMPEYATEADALSAASIGATNDVTYTSQVPWITAVTVPTTTLPTSLVLTVDPAKRTAAVEKAGLVLFGPATDPAYPFSVRLYPLTLHCAGGATWMPQVGK